MTFFNTEENRQPLLDWIVARLPDGLGGAEAQLEAAQQALTPVFTRRQVLIKRKNEADWSVPEETKE
jgi:hypothetical protein